MAKNYVTHGNMIVLMAKLLYNSCLLVWSSSKAHPKHLSRDFNVSSNNRARTNCKEVSLKNN